MQSLPWPTLLQDQQVLFSGPMTRERVKTIHKKVNSLMPNVGFDTPMAGIILHVDALCV
jgi:hypothetical protein